MIHEIERRKEIWIALSAFYLDTELSGSDYNHIVYVFKRSEMPLQEIKLIDLYEVFPALQKNLWSAAGIWDGFDSNWLQKECVKYYYRKENVFHRQLCHIFNYCFYGMRKDCWKEIEKRYH